MRTRQFKALGATLAVAGILACAGEPAEEATPEAETAAPPAATTPAETAPAATATAQLPEGVTQAMVDAGKQAFETTICYTCHAMDGSGTPLAPNLRDDVWLNADGTLASIEATIRSGVPEPKEHPAPMPPMGGAQLTDEQVTNLAAYVYSISHGG